jgi:hypothetical protein
LVKFASISSILLSFMIHQIKKFITKRSTWKLRRCAASLQLP